MLTKVNKVPIDYYDQWIYIPSIAQNEQIENNLLKYEIQAV